jgi:integrase
VRLRAAYGTPEFEDEYRSALSGDAPQKAGKARRGTLEWLWDRYRETAAWKDLSAATRKQRENIMRPVLAASGRRAVESINRESVEAGVKKRQDTPTQAKHFVTTMRKLFEWAIAADLATIDPTRGVEFKTVGKKAKASGFPVWTDDEMRRFEQRWPRGTRERVAFDIYQYTGLRRGDAAKVGKQHVKAGVISIQTEKTGMWVHLPIQPELQATLDAGPVGDLAFIATLDGRPMTKESLGNLFRDACRAAGISKSAHGIRKAAATAAADNGATESELEALFGWSGGQMASLYTRSANRKRLAAGAAAKMVRPKTGTSIPSPEDEVRAVRRKRKQDQ